MNAIHGVLAGAVVALATLFSGCAGVPPVPDATAKRELAPGGSLRVAVFTGNPVIGTSDKATKEVRGTTAILGRELAQQAGLPVQVIEYTSVAKMVDDARTGAWDVAVVAFDPGRRNVLDFAPPHLSVDLTYLIAPGADIKSVADADRKGVSITAARGAATALYLERTLKQAALTPAENEPAAFELIKQGKAQAYAQNRYMLLGLAAGLPGARVLEDRFSSAEMCLVLPKGRPAALEYVGAFVRHAKSAGRVRSAIDRSGLVGVNVAD
jgi:polar amino acid transport system substrate-binding protein